MQPLLLSANTNIRHCMSTRSVYKDDRRMAYAANLADARPTTLCISSISSSLSFVRLFRSVVGISLEESSVEYFVQQIANTCIKDTTKRNQDEMSMRPSIFFLRFLLRNNNVQRNVLTHLFCLISPFLFWICGRLALEAHIIKAALQWKCWNPTSALICTDSSLYVSY